MNVSHAYRSMAVCTFLLASAALAESESPGFSLTRFEPSERGAAWFALDDLDFRGHLRPAAGVVFDYAHHPLVIYDSKGAPLTFVVRDQLLGHVGGSLALFERVRVGLNLPVVAFAEGQQGAIGQTVFAPPASGALGDLRLAADVRLLGQAGEAFTLAAGARAWLPTGSPAAYGSDGKFRAGPQLVAAGALGAFEYSARVGFLWRQQEFALGSGSVGSEAHAGLAAGVRLWEGKLLVGPEVYGATRATGSQAFQFSEVNTPAEVLLGAHYRGNGWRGALGVAKGLNLGFGVPAYRVVASLEWAPANEVKDADGDGIQDWQDGCPTVPGVASADSAKNGCPPDADGDGIPDAEDACPAVKGVKSAEAKLNGCPPPDADGDGIPDAEDACPAVQGVKSAEAKLNGCPPPDTDGDGIPDSQDACPAVKGDKSADAKQNGCPPPDKDKDGIPDAEDACVDEPGTAAADKRFHGCPEKKDVDTDEVPDREDACLKEPGKRNADPKKNGCPVGAVINGQLVLDQVKFKTNSDVILKESDATLSKVLEVVQQLPATNRYRVEGHTDNQGKPAYNKGLSERRAKSVVAWLAKRGLDAKRFEAQGFGQEKPVATNDTDEGRQANRRVEIHILEGTNQLPAQPAPAK